jgi:biopolymer transport protein ExbD
MRKRFKPQLQENLEVELDLAPLLAVMVKLVPVLLVSSAFVQIMNVETELPQAVKEAIAREPSSLEKKTQIAVEVSKLKGFTVVLWQDGKQTIESVPPSEGKLDLQKFHQALVRIKTENPQVFRLELAPDNNITHQEIISIMDAARKAKDKQVRFPINDKATGKETLTEFMFPEIVFSNVLEG